MDGQKIKREMVLLVSVTLYFACWIGALVLLKQLVLAEYHIAFHRFSIAVIGALILAKVVLVLEHVPMGAWVRTQPAWVEVVLRTALYGFGVLVVLLLEKGFEGRHEHGGFGLALIAEFEEANENHVLANVICVSGALLVFNALSVVRKHLGEGGLRRLFFTPTQHPRN